MSYRQFSPRQILNRLSLWLATLATATVAVAAFSAPASAADNIKIGVTGGPHAQVMDVVK